MSRCPAFSDNCQSRQLILSDNGMVFNQDSENLQDSERELHSKECRMSVIQEAMRSAERSALDRIATPRGRSPLLSAHDRHSKTHPAWGNTGTQRPRLMIASILLKAKCHRQLVHLSNVAPLDLKYSMKCPRPLSCLI